MRTDSLLTRLAALAGVFLLLGATGGCNNFDDPEDGEGVVEVTSTALSGVSLAGGEAVVATLTVAIKDRSGKAGSFFNDVVFTNYTVTFPTDPTPPNAVGIVSSPACPINGSCSLALTLILSGDKAGFAAGDTVFAGVHVDGADLNGNPVTLDAVITIIFTA